MSDTVERWQQTAQAFRRRYDQLTDSHWARPTPCSEWTVRDLVDHAVGTQVRFGGLLGLEAPEAPGATEAPDWATVQAAMQRLLSRPGALEGSVAVPTLGGDLGREQVVDICTNDLLLHTWDLSRAIGADDRLPPRPVSACYAWMQQMPAEIIRSPGRFAPALDVAGDADEQTKLLAFAGRQA
jgi:uncharacterized protein (TIGR03086 family)